MTTQNGPTTRTNTDLKNILACVASVSSRGSSRKLGQEQKKKKMNDGGGGVFFASALTFAQ